jgi:hypothetical protein
MSSATAAPRAPPARVADARRRAAPTSSTSRATHSSVLARGNGRDVVRLVPKSSPLDDAPTSPRGAMGASRVSSATSSTRRRTSSSRGDRLTTRAERETRLVSVLTSLPRRFNLYFQRKSYRLTLWRAISAYFGFYLANVMTLSFGALGINDVVAGALSVAFFEVVTRIYYRSAETNRWLEFINWFKVGYCYSLIADAFKLGS